MDSTNNDPFSADVLGDPYPGIARSATKAVSLREAPRPLGDESCNSQDVVATAKNHAVFSSTGGVSHHWEQRPMMRL